MASRLSAADDDIDWLRKVSKGGSLEFVAKEFLLSSKNIISIFRLLTFIIIITVVDLMNPTFAIARTSESYDKCILSHVGSVKDRYTLSAIKKSCFNLHYRSVKIPNEIVKSGVQVSLKLVNCSSGCIVGTENWHEVFVLNNTTYRLTAIKLEFDQNKQKKIFEVMNHPFSGNGDIDYLHVLPFSNRHNYFLDLKSLDLGVGFRIVEMYGVPWE